MIKTASASSVNLQTMLALLTASAPSLCSGTKLDIKYPHHEKWGCMCPNAVDPPVGQSIQFGYKERCLRCNMTFFESEEAAAAQKAEATRREPFKWMLHLYRKGMLQHAKHISLPADYDTKTTILCARKKDHRIPLAQPDSSSIIYWKNYSYAEMPTSVRAAGCTIFGFCYIQDSHHYTAYCYSYHPDEDSFRFFGPRRTKDRLQVRKNAAGTHLDSTLAEIQAYVRQVEYAEAERPKTKCVREHGGKMKPASAKSAPSIPMLSRADIIARLNALEKKYALEKKAPATHDVADVLSECSGPSFGPSPRSPVDENEGDVWGVDNEVETPGQ